jgi:NAD(P)-dependent dehydrogenase (short-subunit alcohol dehydrogenase family)
MASTVLITGAGRGLGLEFARQYAADGWKVIGTVRDAKGEAALAGIAEAKRADVTDRASLKALARDLGARPVDLLIANAGIYGPRNVSFGSLDHQAWAEVFRVNVLGAAATAEALVDNVAASIRKTIVLMSSRMGSITEAMGGELPYITSKAALNMLASAMARELRPRGVIVIALSPGWVKTDMGGPFAPLEPATSIANLRKLLAGLTPEHSGRFLAYDGSQIPW